MLHSVEAISPCDFQMAGQSRHSWTSGDRRVFMKAIKT
jgi:hypothetical protein